MKIFNSAITLPPCTRTGCRDGRIVDSYGNPQQQKNGFELYCDCYYQNKYIEANIGKAYWDLTTDNFEGHPADLARIKKIIMNIPTMHKTGQGLYIHGGYGAGKTTLAILLLKHILHYSKATALFAPFADVVILNSRIVGGFSDKDAEQKITYVKNIDFLVLDDIGKEFDNGKDYTRATLNSILRYRDSWNKPTIYTANNRIEELRHYGESNYSIINGRSNVFTTEYDSDYRQEKRKDIG